MAGHARVLAALATTALLGVFAAAPAHGAASAEAANELKAANSRTVPTIGVPSDRRPPPPTPRSLGFGSRMTLFARSTTSRRVPSARSRLATRLPATTSAGGATANATASTVVTGAHSTYDVSFDAGFAAHLDAESAFLAAVRTWADAMYSPVVLQIQANFQDMGDNSVLGSGGPNDFLASVPGGQSNTAYPVALGDAMDRQDYEGNAPDIVVTLNSTFPAWYFGTNGQTPGTNWDLETVALHELGHGLGFVSSFSANGDLTGDGTHTCPVGAGCYGAYPDFPIPFVFDRFMTTAASSGTALLTYPEASTALGTALTSGNVYWSGARGIAGAGGVRPQLFAPSPWEPGSSASHLDETRYPKGDPNSLMSPIFDPGEAQHSIGPIALGMLDDLGWNESAQYVVAAYHDVVGRAPSASELAFAATALTSGGLPRGSFAFILADSTEAISKSVQAVYQSVLGRPGDSGGVAFWTQQIQAGALTPAQVGAQFYASIEYFTNVARSDLATWVGDLYKGILGRPGDSGGIAFWSGDARLRGRLVVATAFYQSLEWRQRRVTMLYLAFLGRPPDSGGLAYWSQQLATVSDVVLTAQLASSNEYYNRVQSRAFL